MERRLELKARVDDPHAVREQLEQRARFLRTDEMQDIYFAPSDVPFEEIDFVRGPVFRLRIVDDEYVVSCHEPVPTEDGTERTRQISFMVSDGESFRAFARRLGYVPVIEKAKRSDLFTYGEIDIELATVEGLGTFIELEYEPFDPEVEETPRLQAALSALGVPREAIVDRLYVELLQESRIQRALEETDPGLRLSSQPADG